MRWYLRSAVLWYIVGFLVCVLSVLPVLYENFFTSVVGIMAASLLLGGLFYRNYFIYEFINSIDGYDFGRLPPYTVMLNAFWVWDLEGFHKIAALTGESINYIHLK